MTFDGGNQYIIPGHYSTTQTQSHIPGSHPGEPLASFRALQPVLHLESCGFYLSTKRSRYRKFK